MRTQRTFSILTSTSWYSGLFFTGGPLSLLQLFIGVVGWSLQTACGAGAAGRKSGGGLMSVEIENLTKAASA